MNPVENSTSMCPTNTILTDKNENTFSCATKQVQCYVNGLIHHANVLEKSNNPDEYTDNIYNNIKTIYEYNEKCQATNVLDHDGSVPFDKETGEELSREENDSSSKPESNGLRTTATEINSVTDKVEPPIEVEVTVLNEGISEPHSTSNIRENIPSDSDQTIDKSEDVFGILETDETDYSDDICLQSTLLSIPEESIEDNSPEKPEPVIINHQFSDSSDNEDFERNERIFHIGSPDLEHSNDESHDEDDFFAVLESDQNKEYEQDLCTPKSSPKLTELFRKLIMAESSDREESEIEETRSDCTEENERSNSRSTENAGTPDPLELPGDNEIQEKVENRPSKIGFSDIFGATEPFDTNDHAIHVTEPIFETPKPPPRNRNRKCMSVSCIPSQMEKENLSFQAMKDILTSGSTYSPFQESKPPVIKPPPRKKRRASASLSDISMLSINSFETSPIKAKINFGSMEKIASPLEVSEHRRLSFSSPLTTSVLLPQEYPYRASASLVDSPETDASESTSFSPRKTPYTRKKSYTFTTADQFYKEAKQNVTDKRHNNKKSLRKTLSRTFSLKRLNSDNHEVPPCMPNLWKRLRDTRKKKRSSKVSHLSTIPEHNTMPRSETTESFASIFMAKTASDDDLGTSSQYVDFDSYVSSSFLKFPDMSETNLRRSSSNFEMQRLATVSSTPPKPARLKRSTSFIQHTGNPKSFVKRLVTEDSTVSLNPDAIRRAHELLNKSIGSPNNERNTKGHAKHTNPVSQEVLNLNTASSSPTESANQDLKENIPMAKRIFLQRNRKRQLSLTNVKNEHSHRERFHSLTSVDDKDYNEKKFKAPLSLLKKAEEPNSHSPPVVETVHDVQEIEGKIVHSFKLSQNSSDKTPSDEIAKVIEKPAPSFVVHKFIYVDPNSVKSNEDDLPESDIHIVVDSSFENDSHIGACDKTAPNIPHKVSHIGADDDLNLSYAESYKRTHKDSDSRKSEEMLHSFEALNKITDKIHNIQQLMHRKSEELINSTMKREAPSVTSTEQSDSACKWNYHSNNRIEEASNDSHMLAHNISRMEDSYAKGLGGMNHKYDITDPIREIERAYNMHLEKTEENITNDDSQNTSTLTYIQDVPDDSFGNSYLISNSSDSFQKSIQDMEQSYAVGLGKASSVYHVSLAGSPIHQESQREIEGSDPIIPSEVFLPTNEEFLKSVEDMETSYYTGVERITCHNSEHKNIDTVNPDSVKAEETNTIKFVPANDEELKVAVRNIEKSYKKGLNQASPNYITLSNAVSEIESNYDSYFKSILKDDEINGATEMKIITKPHQHIYVFPYIKPAPKKDADPPEQSANSNVVEDEEGEPCIFKAVTGISGCTTDGIQKSDPQSLPKVTNEQNFPDKPTGLEVSDDDSNLKSADPVIENAFAYLEGLRSEFRSHSLPNNRIFDNPMSEKNLSAAGPSLQHYILGQPSFKKTIVERIRSYSESVEDEDSHYESLETLPIELKDESLSYSNGQKISSKPVVKGTDTNKSYFFKYVEDCVREPAIPEICQAQEHPTDIEKTDSAKDDFSRSTSTDSSQKDSLSPHPKKPMKVRSPMSKRKFIVSWPSSTDDGVDITSPGDILTPDFESENPFTFNNSEETVVSQQTSTVVSEVRLRTWSQRQDDLCSSINHGHSPVMDNNASNNKSYINEDTPSPGPPIEIKDELLQVSSDTLQKKDDRAQKDRCIEVYPETLRQRQRAMAPSPSKVDIKNWDGANAVGEEDGKGKKFLPSVKALRNQFENGTREGSPSPPGSYSLGRSSNSSSTSSLAMSSIETSSGFNSMASSQTPSETPKEKSPEVPVEPIYRQFSKIESTNSTNSLSSSEWNPESLLKRLYKLPEAPKANAKSRAYENIEGYLEKLPSGRKKSTYWNAWKRRYFCATDGILYCYQNHQKEKVGVKLPLMGGRIEVMDPNVVSVEDGNREKLCTSMLGIDDGKGHYIVVRCTSRQEAERWKSALDTQVVEDCGGNYVQPIAFPTNPSMLRDTIVIDIGSASVRAGVLASQATLPQLFFPSVVATNRQTQRQIWGTEALCSDVRAASTISFPVRPSHRISKYSVDLNAVSSLLQKTFQDLKVDPKNYNVQLSVPRVLNPNTQAELLKTLFDKHGVKGVNLTHQSILALFAYNATSGIVVDVGERIDVVPVTDGYIVDGGVSRVPYGGSRIYEHLKHFLSQRNVSLVNETDTYVARAILESICYCAQNYNSEKTRCTNDPESFEKEADLDKYFPLTPEYEALKNVSLDFGRFQATEGLFNPDAWGLDHPGLHKLVHKAIQECSMDIRKEMSRSIFLAGGVSQLPGLPDRLATELDKLTPAAIRPKVHSSPYRYHAAYLGACVLAESPTFTQSRISREEWQKQGNSVLRKWSL